MGNRCKPVLPMGSHFENAVHTHDIYATNQRSHSMGWVMTKPTIKICAVAKDEGPYLAEWVFHHLHFGFDSIHVFINRTSDSSAEVLDRINRQYPQVTYEFIDWIDQCDFHVSSKLQTIAYAQGLYQSRQQQVDWLMFLDIDEFWVPDDFKTSVDQLVTEIASGRPKPICHLWHCELGRDEPFSSLASDIDYKVSSHLKTLFPLRGVRVRRVRIHYPVFNNGVIAVDPNGEPMEFDEKNAQLASQSVIAPKRAYVVHRMYRSEDEYLAALLRGRPSQRQQLKTNRPSYRSSRRNAASRLRFRWPETEFGIYDREKRKFLEAIDHENLVAQDRANILARAQQAVSLLKDMLTTSERDQALKCLNGTRYMPKEEPIRA